MDIKEEVQNLKDLCLQSIAEDVVHHSKMSTREDRQAFYGVIKRKFGNVLLKNLCCIPQPRKKTAGSSTKYSGDFLFLGKSKFCNTMCTEGNVKMCLDFIFTEFVTDISINCQCRVRSEISPAVLLHIFSNCKNSEILDLHRMCFNQTDFLKTVLYWKNLVKLNLSQTSCSDTMVIEIWNNLHDLRELRLAFCPNITDVSIRHLCKNMCFEAGLPFCKKYGSCCNLGKELNILDIDYTQITYPGVACALLHLQSLEYLFFFSGSSLRSYVPDAILGFLTYCVALKMNHRFCELCSQHPRRLTSEVNGSFPVCLNLPHLKFKLKHIDCADPYTRGNVTEVLSVCPYLEKITLYAYPESLEVLVQNYTTSINGIALIFPFAEVSDTAEFRHFLKIVGDHLQILVINLSLGELKFQRIVEILQECKHLVEFRIIGYLKITTEDADIVRHAHIPSAETLQILDLSGVIHFDLTHQVLFEELLSQMMNLQVLEVSSFLTENTLPLVTKLNDFSHLEHIIINDANISDPSVETFLSNCNNSIEIELSDCSNVENFFEKYKDTVGRKNFSVKTTNQRTTFEPWKRHHELISGKECCRPWFERYPKGYILPLPNE